MKKTTTKVNIEDLPPLLRLSLTAKVLSVSPNTLRLWDKSGKLIAVRVGSRQDRRYKKEDIVKIMNEGIK